MELLERDGERAVLQTAIEAGVVVAVLGEADEETATTLARLGREGLSGICLLLRTNEWAGGSGPRGSADERRERIATMLRQGDWRVAEAGPADTPSQAWDRALGRAPVVAPVASPSPSPSDGAVGPEVMAGAVPGLGVVPGAVRGASHGPAPIHLDGDH